MKARQSIWLWGALGFGSLIMLFPLWWMLVVSLETPGRAGAATASAEGFAWWPQDPQWSNYPQALQEVGTRPWFGFLDAWSNSVVVTVLSVVGTVLSCSLVGYAFARIRFRGSRALFVLMLSTMMLPAQVTMIPLFLLFRSLGWVDSLLPLIVPAFFGNAFFIFMFRQFCSQVPEALVEAARMDGYGHLGIWWRIMLPMCRPVVAICSAFTFIYVWNDFLAPLIYLHGEEKATLAVALNSFRNQYGGLEDIQYLMAFSLVTMLPCILLFFVAQKQFVGGLTMGAVKG
ncbi:MAG: carbohydrate ABC transporter permease [Planctomycetota bacterium]|nr:MAG: carbohydrate ABC transporter permease [Planctomycetota bacterium]